MNEIIERPFCTVRPDLTDLGLSVPVGDTFVNKGEYQYRWLNHDVFQIFYEGKWCDANSVDFMF